MINTAEVEGARGCSHWRVDNIFAIASVPSRAARDVK